MSAPLSRRLNHTSIPWLSRGYAPCKVGLRGAIEFVRGEGEIMANKPRLALAGALLSAVVVSGCESGRLFYDGPRSYAPPPAPASVAYAQPTQWNNPSRMMAAT